MWLEGMGAKVQLDNYYSMRDLNHDSTGTSWPSYYGENNLANGHYYHNPLPRPSPDLFPGVDRDNVKQKMLEHEAVFKNQVFELHRVYRVQKDLMDEIRRKEGFNHRTACEASSSSSPFPPQMANGKRSSNILFAKDSESRHTKSRRMFDLQLPAEEYVDTDEVEQHGNQTTSDKEEKLFPVHHENTKYPEITSNCGSSSRRPNALADLNEPPESEETTANQSVNFLGGRKKDELAKVHGSSEDFSWKSKHHNLNETPNSSHCNGRGSGPSWLSSVLKTDGIKGNGKSVLRSQPVQDALENPHHPPGFFPPQRNDSRTFDKARSSSNLVNSWDFSSGRPGSYARQNSFPVQTAPYAHSAGFNKRSQSLVQSNDHANGFHHGSSSANGRCLIDLNSNGDLNLNEPVAQPEDPVSVLPWLTSKVPSNDTASSRISPTKLQSEKKNKVFFDINVPIEDPEEFGHLKDERTEPRCYNATRHVIDLNLEAPIDDELSKNQQEIETVAAEAIVAISTFVSENVVDEASGSEDALGWFAELVCSRPDASPVREPDESNESDSFEEMNLKLTQCSVEEYFPNPPKFEFPAVDEANPTGRARRGNPRRGRQKKDFQRDILPGLTALARNEVTEDMQTFGGLMKATGHAWQCGGRKSASRRGRRRAVDRATAAAASVSPKQQAVRSGEVGPEDRSLTGWGKTTRRPRRQRCPATGGNPAV